jgi:hypothetical protein
MNESGRTAQLCDRELGLKATMAFRFLRISKQTAVT